MHATRGSHEGGSPLAGRPSAATDSHGRHLSTNPDAAAHYRDAQDHVGDPHRVELALTAALMADAGFTLAGADLRALGGEAPPSSPHQLAPWERRHVDIVEAARRNDRDRAIALLREHLVDVGCDPLASHVVAHAFADATHGELADVFDRRPSCHSHHERSDP